MFHTIFTIICLLLIGYLVGSFTKYVIKYNNWRKNEKVFNKKYVEWFHSQKETFDRSERFIKRWEGIYGKRFFINHPFSVNYPNNVIAKRFPTQYYHYYDGEIVTRFMVDSRLSNSYTYRKNSDIGQFVTNN